MAQTKKAKPGPKKKKATTGRDLVPVKAGRGKSGRSSKGFKDFGHLLEHPLVAELLAVGAMAAVSAIAEHGVQSRTGEAKKGSKVIKSAGKAAASAMGKRLMTEVDAIRKASGKAAKKTNA
jgi:hypothetical protein